VVEHIGVSTWEQGLKIEVEKEMRKGSGPWGLGRPDHGSWVWYLTLARHSARAGSKPWCARCEDQGVWVRLATWRDKVEERAPDSGGARSEGI
jgi:hypothetical protein